MDAVFHVHDADVSTLIEVRWCLRVVGAIYHLGGGERERGREEGSGGRWRGEEGERREVEKEEGKGREVERGRKEEEEEEGERSEKGKVECSSTEYES